MKKRVVLLGLIILIAVCVASCKQDKMIVKNTGNILATIDEFNITTNNVYSFKNYRKDKISDKKALEIIIENEILYKEANAQGKIVSFKEAQVASYQSRDILKKYPTDKETKYVQNDIKKLKISENNYWHNYYPKQLIKPMSIARMKRIIKEKMISDIMKNHSNWGQVQIQKYINDGYEKAINTLKNKYNVKYVRK